MLQPIEPEQLKLEIEHFEESAKKNGITYWYAHQYMLELGYESWETFQKVINKAMGACSKLNIDVTDVFVPDTYINEKGKEQKTFRLTRFACFLIAMQADERKPEVAKAQIILAAIADSVVSVNHNDLGRIETREDLKLAERIMSKAATEAGVESRQFGIFKDAGFRGMYNMSLQKLQEHKALPTGKTLYDFMGLTELAGNLFRVTQTAERIKSHHATGLNSVYQTAKDVGKEVRTMMIKSSGVTPENLPLEEPINEVKTKIKKVHTKFKKLDADKGKK